MMEVEQFIANHLSRASGRVYASVERNGLSVFVFWEVGERRQDFRGESEGYSHLRLHYA